MCVGTGLELLPSGTGPSGGLGRSRRFGGSSRGEERPDRQAELLGAGTLEDDHGIGGERLEERRHLGVRRCQDGGDAGLKGVHTADELLPGSSGAHDHRGSQLQRLAGHALPGRSDDDPVPRTDVPPHSVRQRIGGSDEYRRARGVRNGSELASGWGKRIRRRTELIQCPQKALQGACLQICGGRDGGCLKGCQHALHAHAKKTGERRCIACGAVGLHRYQTIPDAACPPGGAVERLEAVPAHPRPSPRVRSVQGEIDRIAGALEAAAEGDFRARTRVDPESPLSRIATAADRLIARNAQIDREFNRVCRRVAVEGRLSERAHPSILRGQYAASLSALNHLLDQLTWHAAETGAVARALEQGELARTMPLESPSGAPLRGQALRVARSMNALVSRLRAIRTEVIRIAGEVGTAGRLGGQAQVPGARGAWKELVQAVNLLAANLTSQVRNIALVTTAVARGDLSRKITVPAQGEILELKETVNEMVDQLRAFAAEVTRVAREVGTEGKLGGQAQVPGVAGTWNDLTDSVNEMIKDLRESTQANEEQDWLNTNLARLSGLLQGRRSAQELGQIILSELAPQVSAQYAALFVAESRTGVLLRLSSYGHPGSPGGERFNPGEGLVGQCAVEKRILAVDDIPGDYVRVRSGIGDAPPRSLLVVPALFEGEVKGVIELGSLPGFKPMHRVLLEKLAEGIGVMLNSIATTSRTEHLLGELRASNAELAKRTSDLEDKAQQLALVSRYKSEFLANMSHELRTPLNSILILARLLAENSRSHLDAEEVQYASTIHSSGHDLLTLINQILDLSKIESGRLEVHQRPVDLREVAGNLELMFRPTLHAGIGFSVSISPRVPGKILTDAQRAQQVIKNLLSNAFKFTQGGTVELSIDVEAGGDRFRNASLRGAAQVLALSVKDTGIGIPPDKQEIIFEAFQQADASTSRTFGGTGLGLTISRELARLLGGEIRLGSAPGEGSTFTLYLPLLLPVEAREEAAESAPRPSALPQGQPSPEAVRELKGRVVLLVDDDVHNLFAVTSLLERYGVRVLPAQDANECFELLKSNTRVDLVLMDVMMPEIDGLEATRRIRKKPEHASLPIVALTAKALPGDRERCLEAGCSDFATKPVGPETLAALISKWTRR